MLSSSDVAGFSDPVRGAQSVFRQVMWAMASPGEVREVTGIPAPPLPLSIGAAALVLTLADFETPIWLDPELAAAPDVASYLRFHTGAPIVEDPQDARFAVIATSGGLPSLDSFAQGTLEYPDRSATLIVQVLKLQAGRGYRLKGPGIEGKRHLKVKPLPDDFASRMAANRALFPRGVDIVFAACSSIAALPRTTRVKD